MIYKHSIFSTPVLSWLLSFSACGLLKLSGWKINDPPPEVHRCIIIAAPHTSNWDFVLMLVIVFALKLDVRWMGKHTLFPWPVVWLMKWLGGIPINRTKANNVVEDMINVFHESEHLVLLNTPEGTRSQVSRWKTGFYHMAIGADVSILPVYLDGPNKIVGFNPFFKPSGNLESDLEEIKEIFRGKEGIRPKFS